MKMKAENGAENLLGRTVFRFFTTVLTQTIVESFDRRGKSLIFFCNDIQIHRKLRCNRAESQIATMSIDQAVKRKSRPYPVFHKKCRIVN